MMAGAPARHVCLAGVAGSGKTTIGRALAPLLSAEFLDADAYHPPANVAKMARGEGLSDADRWPWLDAVGAKLRERDQVGVGVVLACSALKPDYRARLRAALASQPSPDSHSALAFVLLTAPPEIILTRLAARPGHFAGPSLLPSQLAALELGDDIDVVLQVDRDPPHQLAHEVVRRLGERAIGRDSQSYSPL